MPCSMYARTIPAVASGRSVSERPPRSSNVYISFWTTSEPAPDVRANTSLSSKTGGSMRLYPYSLQTSSAVSSTRRHAGCREGRMSCVPRGASNTAAQLREEWIACELVAQRRRRTMTGVDDRLRRKALDQSLDGLEQRVPVALRQVGAADGAGEEDIAREQRTVRVVGEMARRVARYVDDLERDARGLDRLASGELMLRLPAANGHPQLRVVVVRALDDVSLERRGIHRCSRSLGEVGHPAEVVPVRVRNEDRDA